MSTARFHHAAEVFDFSPEAAVSVANTPRAAVWRVILADGTVAALKIPDPAAGTSEDPAAEMYRYWNGRAAARILGDDDGTLLLEWLDGPSLGDHAREEDLEGTDATLALMAKALHTANGPVPKALPDLRVWCRALFQLGYDLIPRAAHRDFDRARALASDLLDTAPGPIPLHGDLHHDNVIFTARGPVAFDPKGISGDPAYELANAFRNPRGLKEPLIDPGRVHGFADIASDRLGVPKARILAWAAAKSALSIAWSLPGSESADLGFGYRLLQALGDIAEADYS